MAGPQRKDSTSFDRLLFAGLSDKEIISLYNVGAMRTLEPLEYLVREGEADPSTYLITGGSLKLLRKDPGGGGDVTIAILHKGAWLGNGPDAEGTGSSFSILSPEHTTILSLEQSSFQMLGTRLKSFLRGALAASAARMQAHLSDEWTAWVRKSDALTSFFTHLQKEAEEDYPKIEIIQDLLRGFPRLPLFVDKLTSMLLSDTVSTAEVVEYAKTDPSIVSTTLRRINSPYYNLREKITEFHRAIMLLGFNQIYQIALEECVFELFPKSFKTKEFHLHSILISLIGFELATLVEMQKPTAVSTVGLIHDIGQVLVQLLKNKNHDIIHLVGRLDGSHIAAMLFEKWAFPPSICGTIRYQSYARFAPPMKIPETFRQNVAILHISHLIGEHVQREPLTGFSTIFVDEYMDFLGLKGLSLKELAEKSITPALVKRINVLPEDIRHLLTANLEM